MSTDDVWKICCAWHNLLLEVNILSVKWDGEIGQFYFDEESDGTTFSLQQLKYPSVIRNDDSSGIWPDIDNNEEA